MKTISEQVSENKTWWNKKSELHSTALLHERDLDFLSSNTYCLPLKYPFPWSENAVKSVCQGTQRMCLLGNEHNIPTWLNSSRYERLGFPYSLHHFFQFLGSSLWCHFRRLHYCIIGVIYSKLRKNKTFNSQPLEKAKWKTTKKGQHLIFHVWLKTSKFSKTTDLS